MALTRAQAEVLLVGRTRDLLDAAGMSQVTYGANPDLENALADTLMVVGLVPANVTAVADEDLARLGSTPLALRMFLDYAELRLKRDILARLQVLVTQSAQTSYINLSDMARSLAAEVEQAQARLDALYGPGTDHVVIRAQTRPWGWTPRLPEHWGW
jgi:hypothetical protein